MTCSYCGEQVKETQRFCKNCGSFLGKKKTENPISRDLLTARYCKKCNVEVSPNQKCPLCNGKVQGYGNLASGWKQRPPKHKNNFGEFIVIIFFLLLPGLGIRYYYTYDSFSQYSGTVLLIIALIRIITLIVSRFAVADSSTDDVP